MTITPIAFANGSPAVDMVVDADLINLHPDMVNNRWRGLESYRVALLEAYAKVIFDLKNIGLNSLYIDSSADNIVFFNRVVIYQALMMIFRDFRTERGDRWDLLIGDYQAQYDLAMSDPTLDYDNAAEAAAAEDASLLKTGELRMIR